MTYATPHPPGPDADLCNAYPTAGSLRDAWRALWAAPALVMVAPRLTTPDAWAALALLVASIAVLNADAIARCARRVSARQPVEGKAYVDTVFGRRRKGDIEGRIADDA